MTLATDQEISARRSRYLAILLGKPVNLIAITENSQFATAYHKALREVTVRSAAGGQSIDGEVWKDAIPG